MYQFNQITSLLTGVSVTEWLSLAPHHDPCGLIPGLGEKLSCEKAIKLACRWLYSDSTQALSRSLKVPEGAPGVFLYQYQYRLH